MQLLIQDARAEAPAGGASPTQSGMENLIFIGLLFVVFYFLIIRPQSKKQKQLQTMIANLSKGDEVVTSGGTLGKITKTGDTFLTLEIADGVEIKVQRSAIAQLMPKGTSKSI